MTANLENSAVATGVKKVSFHSNLKERQCQRMFKLLNNCTHFTCQQYNAQNSSSQASTVCELRIFRCHKLDLEKAEEPEIKLPISVGSQKKQESSRKTSTSASLIMLKPFTVWITTNYKKILKGMGIPDHLTCLLRNLHAD